MMKAERFLCGVTLGFVALTAQANGFPEPNPFPYPFDAKPEIYHDGWIDHNKNGEKDIYEDPAQPVEKRVADLLSRMTPEEKAMQCLTLYGYPNACKDKHPVKAWLTERAWKDGIANIDQAADGRSNRNTKDINKTPELNARYINNLQRFFVEQTRLGIPADMTNEGIRGAGIMHGTSFPSPHSQGMTWDVELAEQLGRVMGEEAKAVGYTNIYAPILDVARDQRWGRWEGTIAEDPFLVAEIGKRIAKGLQDKGVASTPKHYVGYGENKGARGWSSRTDPHITAQTFEAIHMYPFKRVFTEVGPLGVMCSYNDINGVPVASSTDLLKKRLRGEFGFKGYVVSDSGAVERLASSMRIAKDNRDAHNRRIHAGLDVWTNFSLPDPIAKGIVKSLKDGSLDMADVDEAVSNVLRVKFMLGIFDKPYVADPASAEKVIGCEEHQKIALQMARECIVLLKNDNATLPLDMKKLKRVAVVGPLADSRGGMPTHYGPVDFKSATVLQGVKTLLEKSGVEVAYAKGCDVVNPGWPDTELIPTPLSDAEQKKLDEAVKTAKQSDVAIVVLGDDAERTSGESRTRNSLNLPGRQEALLEAVYATGKPTILVLIHGRPPAVNWAAKNIPAILACGFPGGHGGTAIAETLFGKYNPGGKTNGTWLRSAGQIPYNFPAKPRSNEEPNVRNRTHYDGSLYPFGFGLSYTTFSIGKPSVEPRTREEILTPGFFSRLFGAPTSQTVPDGWRVTVPVTNTGAVAGDEVVQLYVSYVQTPRVSWFDQMLRGFKRVHLKPGETKQVTFDVPAEHLKIVLDDQTWVLPETPFEIRLGTSSQHIRQRILIKDGKVKKIESVNPKAKPRENLNPLQA